MTDLVSLELRSEPDVVAARQRARKIAALLGFDPQEQTRIATALSEVARNAFQYARGGRVQYSIDSPVNPSLVLTVTDTGPGIAQLGAVLEGTEWPQGQAKAARELGPEHPRVLRAIGARSYISVPLVARGRTLGALTFVSCTDERLYGVEDVALAEDLASRTALLVDNARLYQESVRAVRSRETCAPRAGARRRPRPTRPRSPRRASRRLRRPSPRERHYRATATEQREEPPRRQGPPQKGEEPPRRH